MWIIHIPSNRKTNSTSFNLLLQYVETWLISMEGDKSFIHIPSKRKTNSTGFNLLLQYVETWLISMKGDKSFSHSSIDYGTQTTARIIQSKEYKIVKPPTSKPIDRFPD